MEELLGGNKADQNYSRVESFLNYFVIFKNQKGILFFVGAFFEQTLFHDIEKNVINIFSNIFNSLTWGFLKKIEKEG